MGRENSDGLKIQTTWSLGTARVVTIATARLRCGIPLNPGIARFSGNADVLVGIYIRADEDVGVPGKNAQCPLIPTRNTARRSPQAGP